MNVLLSEHKELFIIAFVGILLTAAALTAVICFVIARRKKDPIEKELEEKSQRKAAKIMEARKVVAPDGINPNPLSYTVVQDCGHDVYIRSFTVDSLPKRTVFAVTFPALFNFDRMNSSVFIEPITEGRASHLLDERVVEIETNIITAEKNADRNQIRKLTSKLRDTADRNGRQQPLSCIFPVYDHGRQSGPAEQTNRCFP